MSPTRGAADPQLLSRLTKIKRGKGQNDRQLRCDLTSTRRKGCDKYVRNKFPHPLRGTIQRVIQVLLGCLCDVEGRSLSVGLAPSRAVFSIQFDLELPGANPCCRPRRLITGSGR